MIAIINIFYALIVLGFVLTSVFIVYHLVKYTIHSSLNFIALIVFVVIAIPLLISNVILFGLIDWQGIIANLPI